MHFDDVLDGFAPDGEGWRCTVADDWAQGRTLFGGLQAAMALHAIRKEVDAALPLRVLQTSFVAPVAAGPVRLRAQVLRRGGSTVHAEGRLLDEAGQTLCFALAIFGKARASSLALAPTQPASAPPDRPDRELPFIAGVTPAFTQHFQMRWGEGGMPFTGAQDARTRIHLRYRDAMIRNEAQVVALADAIPSPGLSMLRKPAPSSSLTWTLELLEHDHAAAGDGWWRIDSEITAGRDGYLAQDGHLWNPAGGLAALSRQSVVIFG